MRWTSAFAVIAAVALALSASSPALTKPKKLSFGCTMAQIQDAANNTAAGRECSKKQDDAVINDTTFYVFTCVSDGIYCCPVNASSASECTKISSASRARLDKLNAVINRGALKKLGASTPTTKSPERTTAPAAKTD